MFSALTFNMQNGQGWDDAEPDSLPVSLSGTLEFLTGQNADILFLQEVEQGYEGGFQADPPPNYTWLREHLAGYDSVFAYPMVNPQELPFGLGLAIFSRWPLRNFHRIDLPPAEVEFEFDGVKRQPSHRLLISAETEVSGHPLRLLNTHLQAFFMINATSDEHRAQRDLVEREMRSGGAATLLGGDFNCAPGESLIEQFRAAGYETAQGGSATWKRMPFVLDHLFYSASLRLERCEVVPTPASDHHAVRSEFSFA